ncbi:MAG: hypothetical protein KTV77_04135 [Wolbachia endosymbiont of Fragariocoptes setiger]|nr:hypothetical protein [Wolbachia endosymbiont of Fragariocoptes setiger]
MKTYKLKRKVTFRFLLYCLLLSILVLLLVFNIIYSKSIYRKNKSVIDRIKLTNLQIVAAQNKEVKISKYVDLWQKISSLNGNSYISDLNFELDVLYKKYFILDPEISISAPEDVEISYSSEYMRVVKSKVVLSFSSVSDKHIFLFLQSIPSLSGYVMIKSLRLSKEKDIDNVTMMHISNGDMIATVNANITFDWYTVLKNEG